MGLIDEEVGEMQFGFRKKTGTRKAMLALKMLGEKYLQMQREVYLFFIAVVGNHRAAGYLVLQSLCEPHASRTCMVVLNA